MASAAAALSMGALSDRMGRLPVVLGSVGAMVVGAVPITLAAQSGSLAALVLAEVVAGVAVGGMLSISTLAAVFPTTVRETGLGLTAGLATAIAGGTASLVDQVLLLATGFELAPAAYVACVAAIAFVAVRSWPETAFLDLVWP